MVMKGQTVTYSCVRAFRKLSLAMTCAAIAILGTAGTVAAQDNLCDNSYQDCRTPLINLINQETAGIDVSYWFMTDSVFANAIIQRANAGVPVRIILDLRADTNYPSNASIRQGFINAGIPIRHKTTPGINHWKMLLFAGQGRVMFGAANFAFGSFQYSGTPYHNYVDEAIYTTDDDAVVDAFKTKFDNLWTDTTHFANLANISAPLTRTYSTSTTNPELNFPPDASYQSRLASQLQQETVGVDAIMFRITSGVIPDRLIALHNAGVPVRLISDLGQYRNPSYFWHSYNIDRMHAAGIDIKFRNNPGDEAMHQKSVILRGRGMTVYGSSNWTASSSDSQREHNYFTTKPFFLQWFTDQFERKWNNQTANGAPISPLEYVDFVPGYPEMPENLSPVNDALGQGSSVTLRWEGGYWAHRYDIYFGTAPFTTGSVPAVTDYAPGSATAGKNTSARESYTFTNLQPGVTYYWKILGKTMAGRAVNGPTWRFTTSGGGTVPAAPTGLTGSAISAARVDLNWSDVESEEGYKVERKLSSSTTWTQIALLGANVVSYTDQNSGLQGATSYNYRVRAYTTAGNSPYSNTVTVTTPGVTLSARDVVLYASEAPTRVGSWTPVGDPSAAGGQYLNNTNAGAVLQSPPLATPNHYFEMSFTAQAGTGYRIWLRGKALNNNGSNDSVWLQFAGSVNQSGTPMWRIGSTSGTYVNIEENKGTGLDGWGWQDNGYGIDVLGPLVYFETTGTQTLRIQVREDGIGIDQIVLSPDTFLTTAPGGNRLDNTKLPKQNGASSSPPPSSATARIIGDAYVRGGSYASTSFGAVPEIIAKFSADPAYLREGFIKLDIGAVQPGDTVTLRLNGRLSDTRAASVTTNIYAASSVSWGETTLTYNNSRALATATALGSVVVSGTTSQWYEVDLTSYVQAQRAAGATTIAIALKNPADTLPYVTFRSRESSTGQPELVFSN
jgi:phosphatidylserine/phosphatidylglycerophosphate/cardiolipin synthase-like enzyme